MKQDIIPPIDRKLLQSELTEDKFLRYTNKGGNLLYVLNHHNSPNVMQEIGRLREEAFRNAGGGTGKSADIDSYDTSLQGFDQLIVWDPEDLEIVAGYRLMRCDKAEKDSNGRIITATSHLFNLSDAFYDKYLPFTIELGRSFVQTKYQSRSSRKGVFSLDNLWDGLGAVVLQNPEIKYLFGKVTMYPSYDVEARNWILSFMNHFFPDREGLASPIDPVISLDKLAPYKTNFEGLSYKEALQKLGKFVKEKGENIPPLINSYMNLSSTMMTFGTAPNDEFGAVEETGILVTIADIYDAKKERHLDTFEKDRSYKG
ncbi:MAG: GNAT family N-acetyltransferase [Cyclobacteriaceae bacterium]